MIVSCEKLLQHQHFTVGVKIIKGICVMKGKLIEPCVTWMMNEENDKELRGNLKMICVGHY